MRVYTFPVELRGMPPAIRVSGRVSKAGSVHCAASNRTAAIDASTVIANGEWKRVINPVDRRIHGHDFIITLLAPSRVCHPIVCVGVDWREHVGSVVSEEVGNRPPSGLSVYPSTFVAGTPTDRRFARMDARDPDNDQGDSHTFAILCQSVADAFTVSGYYLKPGTGAEALTAGDVVSLLDDGRNRRCHYGVSAS